MAIQSSPDIQIPTVEKPKDVFAGLTRKAQEWLDKLAPKQESTEKSKEAPKTLEDIQERVKEEEAKNTAETEERSLEMELQGIADGHGRRMAQESQNAGYISYYGLSDKKNLAAEDVDAQKIMTTNAYGGSYTKVYEHFNHTTIQIGRESVDIGHNVRSAADFIEGYDRVIEELAKEEATAPASVAPDLATFAKSDRIKDYKVSIGDDKGRQCSLNLGDIAKTSPDAALKIFNNIWGGSKEIYGLNGKEPRSKEMIALSLEEVKRGLQGFAAAALKTGDISTALEAYQRLGSLEEHASEFQNKIEELMENAKTGIDRLSLKGQLEDLTQKLAQPRVEK